MNIFGHLNIADSTRILQATPGQEIVWQAVQDYLTQYNSMYRSMSTVFVARQTDAFKRKYKLPPSGYMQRRGSNSRPAATKVYGSWDVAFPLEDFGDAAAWNDVDQAYLTAEDLSLHVYGMAQRSLNTRRYEILKAILHPTTRTLEDPVAGSLTIQPLANGDAVLYPPVAGSETEATDSHYLESGYATSAIDATHNPIAEVIVPELIEHFGGSQTGGSNVVTFVNTAERAKLEALAGFVEVPDRFVRIGQDSSLPVNLPTVPGEIIGRCDGSWISVWDYIPATYMVGTYLDVEAPLNERVDPADTGLGQGLQLVAVDDQYPFHGAFWRDRFGFGAANRLNGVVLELGTGGGYTTPTGY